MPEFLNLSLSMYDGVGEMDIPVIQPVYELPKIDIWLEFEKAKRLRTKPQKAGVHFFEYDFKFESVWNFPDRYADVLSAYDCILSPDFSMYVDFPKAVRIFNKYRNHWISAYWQEKGLTVIPVIRPGAEEDWDTWGFDGYPTHSIVAVSNIGCNQRKDAKLFWRRGYEKMLETLEPSEILVYTNSFDYLPGNVHYIKYDIDKHIEGIDDVEEEDDG